eukprot:746597-Karenia_brevis.AAC.1
MMTMTMTMTMAMTVTMTMTMTMILYKTVAVYSFKKAVYTLLVLTRTLRKTYATLREPLRGT